MKAFQLIPSIAEYADFGTLAGELKLGPADLILTNEYIYDPTIALLDLAATPASRRSTARASRPM